MDPVTQQQIAQLVQQGVQQQMQQMQLQLQQQQLAAHAAAAAMQPAAHAPRPAGPRIAAPSPYGGSATTLDDWLSRMRQQYAWYGDALSTDVERMRFAAAYLSGTALDWWEHLGAARPVTWDAMQVDLRKRFQPVTTAEAARRALRTLTQGKQSVHAYVASFRRLLVAVPGMAEEDRLFAFKEGLHPSISMQLNAQGVETLDAAVAMASRIGGARDVAASVASSSSSAAAHAPMDLDALQIDGIEGLERDTDGADESADADAPITRRELQQQLQRQHQQMLNAMREQRSSSSAPASKGSARSGRFQPRGPPRIPHLSEEQVKEYMAAGKCFGCGSTEHSARACPKRKVGADGRPSWSNSKPSN